MQRPLEGLGETIVQSHAKCILAGEHTLLQGGKAVVWPLKTLTIQLRKIPERGIWSETSTGKRYPFPGGDALLGFLEAHSDQVGCGQISFGQVDCGLLLKVDMPLGVGLGGSAALGVAVARALAPAASREHIFAQALQIDKFFHGESSGADVAGAMAQTPILYQRTSFMQRSVRFAHAPSLFLSLTRERGATRAAIQQVAALTKRDHQQGQEIREQMTIATQQVLRGLEIEGGWSLLQEGIERARGCFEKWGLVTESMRQNIQMLYNQGASAVKPTGSGGGGCLLSLWDHAPPTSLGLLPVEVCE